MSCYLVDYENVNKDGLNGVNQLTAGDSVCIFYSENADTLSFSLHHRLVESKANISFILVESKTKNALDFQLVTYLGYLIAADKSVSYFIVSKDNGFGSACDFWARQNVRVSMIADLSGRNMEQEAEELLGKVGKLISDRPTAEVIVGYIQKYKTKQGINNALVKEYGSKKGGDFYKLIKTLIRDKKGTDTLPAPAADTASQDKAAEKSSTKA